MTTNQQISDRQYAASIARKYLNGQISKYQIINNFSDYKKDIKIRLLYKHIVEKPKRCWFLGVSKEKYEKYINEIYEIIEDLETDELRLKTMKILFKQLWLQSNNCSKSIENIGFQIFEVSKMTYNSKKEILRYLNLLIEKGYIRRISEEPLLYEFTETGKKIKTDSEIEEIIKNVG